MTYEIHHVAEHRDRYDYPHIAEHTDCYDWSQSYRTLLAERPK